MATAHLNDIEIEDEIADLERRLIELKARRSHSHSPPLHQPSPSKTFSSNLNSPTHFLLLLSDSALPLGSFAFSSGLESYLSHQKIIFRQASSFVSFLPLSISSYASSNLPFVLAAHRDPSLSNLAVLDDALDAAIVCTVGKRASVSQGRALLSIWERAFAGSVAESGTDHVRSGTEALKEFSSLLKSASSNSNATSHSSTLYSAPSVGSTSTINANSSSITHPPKNHDDNHDRSLYTDDDDPPPPPPVAAHLAPLFGAICALVGLSLEQTAYVFLLGHVKALVSAAVRAGMFGPYQAQKTLASGAVQGLIAAMVEREWATPVEEAGQSVPVMDLWVGRHEVLYSRIFNS